MTPFWLSHEIHELEVLKQSHKGNLKCSCCSVLWLNAIHSGKSNESDNVLSKHSFYLIPDVGACSLTRKS